MIEIYRSSRIETLATLLAAEMRRSPPASVLSPQQVIVGHLGMKRWLIQHLAQQPLAGLPRVAANFDMLLPSEWLERLAQKVLGTEAIAIAPYRRTALRWRIFELLPTLTDPQVSRYLQGDEAPRRRFQLADRLAGLYGQYLVYRRDWLLAWEAGESPVDADWQSVLWRLLVADIGLAHRGQRMRELASRLPALPADPEQPALHVFGVAHLAPDALGALQALSSSRRVIVYFPDPCRELWSDLTSPARALRQLVEHGATRELLDGGAFLEISHPLLASLGRMGQHFCLLLDALSDPKCDLRDRYDETAADLLPPTSSLLERVQHSLRVLNPDAIGRHPDDRRDARSDASLRVHACHTRLRELEVLKDALLDLLAAHPDLQPRQIAVMAPNMALYAPLLPVVFGEPGDSRSLLPYQIADVALVRTHPLLSAVRELLDLPSQRITRSQVLGLLALPALARRFGLDDQRHAALQRWLDRCRVAWGLDGAMKQEFAAAPVDEHSFAFGIDRMAAGLLFGREEPDTLLDGAILPADPVTGPDAECLGALSALLEVLRDWRASAHRSRPLTAWSQQLRDWLERLFVVDPTDDGEREALSAVMQLAARLGEESRDAGVQPEVDWTVVREVLKQELEGIPERQAFLAGGITFCGMVPQRAIPFEVIAMLGLNDGDYPRQRAESGLDLMQRYPRLGDRDNRSDDRYLFLEALMSARRALHLSYIGEGAQDGKPRNPALPLTELLGLLDRQYGLDPTRPGYDPAWHVRHPLQPFDPRYFDPRNADRRPGDCAGNSENADPRLFSYSREFAGLRPATNAGAWRFLAGALPLIAGEAAANIELATVLRFFRDPARFVCKTALKLSRDALNEDAPDDHEPLGIDIDPRDSLPMDLVWSALHAGVAELPLTAPPHIGLSGRYASGELGVRTWASMLAEVQPYLTAARTLAPFASAAAQPESVAIDLNVDGARLLGSVGHVYRCGDEWWLLSIGSSNISFRQLLPLFLQWAALRLSLPSQTCHVAMIYRNGKKGPAIGPPIAFVSTPDRLSQGLGRLLELYRHAELTAGRYYARTSYAFAAAVAETGAKTPKSPVDEARRAWAGNDSAGSVGERDYLPLYNLILAGDDSFIDSPEFEQIARQLMHAIGGCDSAPEAA